MTKHELKEMNAELIELLTFVRDQIDHKLAEFAQMADDEVEDDDPED